LTQGALSLQDDLRRQENKQAEGRAKMIFQVIDLRLHHASAAENRTRQMS